METKKVFERKMGREDWEKEVKEGRAEVVSVQVQTRFVPREPKWFLVMHRIVWH